jgi:hypothetical protein
MKKIFFALSLMLAFTINANAQENKSNAKENAKKESAELAQLVGISGTQVADFERLFEMKNQTFEIKDLSEERKTEMSRIIDLKIRASLTPEQMAKLEANKALYNKLVGKQPEKK